MSKAAQAIGTAGIVPFWNRVPAFFLLPLHPSLLVKMALFAALPALGAFAGSIGTMMIAISGLSLLAWIGFLRFGSRVLSETSYGRLSPEQYDRFGDESLVAMPFKIFALFLAMGLAVGIVAALWGRNAGLAANLFISLCMPASLVVLVVSRSLFSGLNPAASINVMGSIGKPYLLLCLFLFSLSTAQGFLTQHLAVSAFEHIAARFAEIQSTLQHVQTQADAEAAGEAWNAFNSELARMKPRFAGITLLLNLVGMYFTLIAFNMMGYAAYQYHEQLGLDIDEDAAEREGKRAGIEVDPESQRIAELVAAGQIDKALDIAYEAQRLDVENLPANERYHKLLQLAGKADRLLAHTHRLIPLMLRMGRRSSALEVLRRTRETLPAYRPDSAEVVLALAEAARSERQARLALDLLEGFDIRHPRSALLPDALLLNGRILCEDLRDDAQADAMFARIVSEHASHAAAGEAARFRAVLARMAAQLTPPQPGRAPGAA